MWFNIVRPSVGERIMLRHEIELLKTASPDILGRPENATN